MFSLTGSTTLVGQEDSERSSLVAACHLPGLPWAVRSRGPGQKEASRGKRKGKDLEKWQSTQKDQRRQVRAIFIWVPWTFPTQKHYCQPVSRPFQNEIQQVRLSTGASAKKQREKTQGWRKVATHQKHAAKSEPTCYILQLETSLECWHFNWDFLHGYAFWLHVSLKMILPPCNIYQ